MKKEKISGNAQEGRKNLIANYCEENVTGLIVI